MEVSQRPGEHGYAIRLRFLMILRGCQRDLGSNVYNTKASDVTGEVSTKSKIVIESRPIPKIPKYASETWLID